MTAAVGESARPTTGPARQPLGLCAVVAVAVVVGWLAYDHWIFPRLDQHLLGWNVILERWWLVNLSFVVLGYLPYVLVLLLWGRTRARGVAGALIALATAVYIWGLYQVFSNYIWGDNPGTTSTRVYTWAGLLVAPVLAALAWGVARRWGRWLWMLGLLVAPLVAATFHELALRSTWWRTHLIAPREDHWLMNELVVVVPVVAAAMACWWVDEVDLRRRAVTGPAYDEGPPPR